ncbi:GNAT family N-acetyltransferase [Nocardia sp. NPDC004568]|uniref:GNAT family N-acetyltransferase n=1 Tax=Nocardia sp. NPDC004568 TaxID=3154551 RepID=UPI0033B0EC79
MTSPGDLTAALGLVGELPEPIPSVVFGQDFPNGDAGQVSAVSQAWRDFEAVSAVAVSELRALVSEMRSSGERGEGFSASIAAAEELQRSLDQVPQWSRSFSDQLDSEAFNILTSQLESAFFGVILLVQFYSALMTPSGPVAGIRVLEQGRTSFLQMMRGFAQRAAAEGAAATARRAGLAGARLVGGTARASVGGAGLMAAANVGSQIAARELLDQPVEVDWSLVRGAAAMGAGAGAGGFVVGRAVEAAFPQAMGSVWSRLVVKGVEGVAGAYAGAAAGAMATGHFQTEWGMIANALAGGAVGVWAGGQRTPRGQPGPGGAASPPSSTGRLVQRVGALLGKSFPSPSPTDTVLHGPRTMESPPEQALHRGRPAELQVLSPTGDRGALATGGGVSAAPSVPAEHNAARAHRVVHEPGESPGGRPQPGHGDSTGSGRALTGTTGSQGTGAAPAVAGRHETPHTAPGHVLTTGMDGDRPALGGAGVEVSALPRHAGPGPHEPVPDVAEPVAGAHQAPPGARESVVGETGFEAQPGRTPAFGEHAGDPGPHDLDLRKRLEAEAFEDPRVRHAQQQVAQARDHRDNAVAELDSVVRSGTSAPGVADQPRVSNPAVVHARDAAARAAARLEAALAGAEGRRREIYAERFDPSHPVGDVVRARRDRAVAAALENEHSRLRTAAEQADAGYRAALVQEAGRCAQALESAEIAHDAVLRDVVEERFADKKATAQERIDEADRHAATMVSRTGEQMRQAQEGLTAARTEWENTRDEHKAAVAGLDAKVAGHLDDCIRSAHEEVAAKRATLAEFEQRLEDYRRGAEPEQSHIARLAESIAKAEVTLRKTLARREGLLRAASGDHTAELRAAEAERNDLLPRSSRPGFRAEVATNRRYWQRALAEHEGRARARVASLQRELDAHTATYQAARAKFTAEAAAAVDERFTLVDAAGKADMAAFKQGVLDYAEAARHASDKRLQAVVAADELASLYYEEMVSSADPSDPVAVPLSEEVLRHMIIEGSRAERHLAMRVWAHLTTGKDLRVTQRMAWALEVADVKTGEGKTLLTTVKTIDNALEHGVAHVWTSSDCLVLEMVDSLHSVLRSEHGELPVDTYRLAEMTADGAFPDAKPRRHQMFVGTPEEYEFLILRRSNEFLGRLEQAGASATEIATLRHTLFPKLRGDRPPLDEIIAALDEAAQQHGLTEQFEPLPGGRDDKVHTVDELDTVVDGGEAVLSPGASGLEDPLRVAELQKYWDRFQAACALPDGLTERHFGRPEKTRGFWEATFTQDVIDRLNRVTDREGTPLEPVTAADAEIYTSAALARWARVRNRDYIVSLGDTPDGPDKLLLLSSDTNDQVQADRTMGTQTQVQGLVGQFMNIKEGVPVLADLPDESLYISVEQIVGSRDLGRLSGYSGTAKPVEKELIQRFGVDWVVENPTYYESQRKDLPEQEYDTRADKHVAMARDILAELKLEPIVENGRIVGLIQHGRPQLMEHFEQDNIHGADIRIDASGKRTPLRNWEDKLGYDEEKGLVDWVDQFTHEHVHAMAKALPMLEALDRAGVPRAEVDALRKHIATAPPAERIEAILDEAAVKHSVAERFVSISALEAAEGIKLDYLAMDARWNDDLCRERDSEAIAGLVVDTLGERSSRLFAERLASQPLDGWGEPGSRTFVQHFAKLLVEHCGHGDVPGRPGTKLFADKLNNHLVEHLWGAEGTLAFVNKERLRGTDWTPTPEAIALGGAVGRMDGGDSYGERVVDQGAGRISRGGKGEDQKTGGTPGELVKYSCPEDFYTQGENRHIYEQTVMFTDPAGTPPAAHARDNTPDTRSEPDKAHTGEGIPPEDTAAAGTRAAERHLPSADHSQTHSTHTKSVQDHIEADTVPAGSDTAEPHSTTNRFARPADRPGLPASIHAAAAASVDNEDDYGPRIRIPEQVGATIPVVEMPNQHLHQPAPETPATAATTTARTVSAEPTSSRVATPVATHHGIELAPDAIPRPRLEAGQEPGNKHGAEWPANQLGTRPPERSPPADRSNEDPRPASPSPWSGRIPDRGSVADTLDKPAGTVDEPAGDRVLAGRLSNPSPGSTPRLHSDQSENSKSEPPRSGPTRPGSVVDDNHGDGDTSGEKNTPVQPATPEAAESTPAPSAEAGNRDGDEPVPPETGESAEDLPPLLISFCTKDRPECVAALLDDIAAVVPGNFTVLIIDDSVDPENRARNRRAIDNAPFDVVYFDEARRTALLAGMPWPSEAAEEFVERKCKVLGRPEWDLAGALTFLQIIVNAWGAPGDRVLMLNDDIRLRDGMFQGKFVSVDSQAVTDLLSRSVPSKTFIGISGDYAGKKDVNHVEDAAALAGTDIEGQSYLHSGINASNAFLLTNVELLGEIPFPNWYGEDNFVMAIWLAMGNALDTTDFSPLHTGDDRNIELDISVRQQYGIVALLAVLEVGSQEPADVFDLLESAVSYCNKYAWKVAQRWAENFVVREHEFGNINLDNVSALLAVEDIAGRAEAYLRDYASSLTGWTDLVKSRAVSDYVRSFLGVGSGRISAPWDAPAPNPTASHTGVSNSPAIERTEDPAVDTSVSAVDGMTQRTTSVDVISAVGVSAPTQVRTDFTTANSRIIDYALGKLRGGVYDSIGMLLAWVEVSVRAALAADPAQDDSDADSRVARTQWEIISEYVMDKIVDETEKAVEKELRNSGTLEAMLNRIIDTQGISSAGITHTEYFVDVASAVLEIGVEVFCTDKEYRSLRERYLDLCRSPNLPDDIAQHWYREIPQDSWSKSYEGRDSNTFRDPMNRMDYRAVQSLVSRSMSLLGIRVGSLHFAWYPAAPRAKLKQWRKSIADLEVKRLWNAPERRDQRTEFTLEFRKPMPDMVRLRRAAEALWAPGSGTDMPERLEIQIERGMEKFVWPPMRDTTERRLWLAGLVATHTIWRRRLDPFDYRMEYLRRMVAPYDINPYQVLDEDPALWRDALDGARMKLIRLLAADSRNIGPDRPYNDDGVIRLSVSRIVGSGQESVEFFAAANEYLEVLQVTDLIGQIARLRQQQRALVDAERLADLISELESGARRAEGSGFWPHAAKVKEVEAWPQRIYELGSRIDQIEQSRWTATADLVDQVRALSSGNDSAGVSSDPAAGPGTSTEFDSELRQLNGDLNELVEKVEVLARRVLIPTPQSSSTESDDSETPFGPNVQWFRSFAQVSLSDPGTHMSATRRQGWHAYLRLLDQVDEVWRDASRRLDGAAVARGTGIAMWCDHGGSSVAIHQSSVIDLNNLRLDLRERRDRSRKTNSSLPTEDEGAIEAQMNALEGVIAAVIEEEYYSSRIDDLSPFVSKIESEAEWFRFHEFLAEGMSVTDVYGSPYNPFPGGVDNLMHFGSLANYLESRSIYNQDNLFRILRRLKISVGDRLRSLRTMTIDSRAQSDAGRYVGSFQQTRHLCELIAARVELLLSSLRDIKQIFDTEANSASIPAWKIRRLSEQLYRLHAMHARMTEASGKDYSRFAELCRNHGFPELEFGPDEDKLREIIYRINTVSLRISSAVHIDPIRSPEALDSIVSSLSDSGWERIIRSDIGGLVTRTLSRDEEAQVRSLIAELKGLLELETLHGSLESMNSLDEEVSHILENAIRIVYGGLDLTRRDAESAQIRPANIAESVWTLYRWARDECYYTEESFDQEIATARAYPPGSALPPVSIWEVQPSSEGQRLLTSALRSERRILANEQEISPVEVTADMVRRLHASLGPDERTRPTRTGYYLALHSAESKAFRFHRYSRWVWTIRALDAAIDQAKDGTEIGESRSSELRRRAAPADRLARKWDQAISERTKIRTRFMGWNIDPDLYTDWLRERVVGLACDVMNINHVWADPMQIDNEVIDQARQIVTFMDIFREIENSESTSSRLNQLFEETAAGLLSWMEEKDMDPGPFRDFRSVPIGDLRAHVISTRGGVRIRDRDRFTYALYIIDLIGVARSGRSPVIALGHWMEDAGEVLVRRVIAKNVDPRDLHLGHLVIDRSDSFGIRPADEAFREPRFFELAKEFRKYDRLVDELENELDTVLTEAAGRILEEVHAAGDEPETVDASPDGPAGQDPEGPSDDLDFQPRSDGADLRPNAPEQSAGSPPSPRTPFPTTPSASPDPTAAVITWAVPEDVARLSGTGSPAWLLEDLLQRQQSGKGVLFVSRIGEQPVGHGYLWLEEAEEDEIREHIPGVPLITHLAVDPAFRGIGLGAQLVMMMENHARTLANRRIALAVFPSNSGAARLYRRLGYQDWGNGPVQCYEKETLPDGTLRRVPDPEKANVMIKDL